MKFVAKTLYGLEQVLSGELVSLGASNIKVLNRAVLFEGNKELLYRVNYCSRTALSVLMPIDEFRIRSKEDLYDGAMRIRWDKYMNDETTFSIVPVVNSHYFAHTGFPALILKDAVADFFRQRKGRRPNVDQNDPDLLINLHISNNLVTISLDSTVVPLYKRGYRKEQSIAPLNEVLAAGMLLISGWDGSRDLVDPMCGSGTIPIEAGLIACNIPPGKFRSSFGFMKWNDYEDDLLRKIKADCEEQIRKPAALISGSDISPKAVEQSEINLASAGLLDYVSIRVSDFADLKSDSPGKYIFINPPYGIRIMPEELNGLYGMIGTKLKHGFPDSSAWIITPNMEALKHVGLKPENKYTLFNGSLKCVLVRYEMYQGSRKR
ncbi:MAG TPA: class I SAM-dependent RNA methyltransferase [Bacteroidales bacterium]|nr:class I SAM-dependent RNA methyltransferase [Bacteroidales bacterium]